jgi:predicted nucleic acid-binding protein
MVVKDILSGTIFLDTSPLIYYIEGHSSYQNVLAQVFEAADAGKVLLLTSSITLLEVLVKPLREGRHELAVQYKEILLNASGIIVNGFDIEISIKAAELRAKYNLRTPDAMQLANALWFGAKFFLTNDLKLKIVSEVRTVTLEDLL